MRILLIATNRHNRLQSRMNAQPLPIGLAYIAGYLDPDRHTLKVLDLMFAGDDYLSEVEDAVREFSPDLVGISLRNLSNHSYLDPQWALPITKEVIQRVHAATRAPVVCGGPAFSILPKECFAFLEPDLGIAGDAGEAFAELANRIEIGEPSYFDLPGLVYRENGEIIYNGIRCLSEFAKPPRLEELDMEKYRQAGFGIGVLTKLGGFYYPTSEAATQTEDGAWRVIRPIDEVVAEVKDLEQRFSLRKIFFIDNCFNVPTQHAKSLCHALMDADLKLRWNTCLAPYNCDAELVGLMKQAGCALVLMGGMGGDSHDGAAIGERLEPLLETTRLCEEGGLHYTISQRFGEPGETRETVDQKLEFLRGLKPAMANLRVGISLLPGTREAALALEEGLIGDESELIKPTFYLAEEVRDWIVDYLKEAAAENPRWNLL
ncbi:MAG: cobalamin-dependent protein [Candidatus Marinimicrobia bacterium]|nr:cobalamin-dependent protein [Candidatus Neomarinimicrobiota bacterium]